MMTSEANTVAAPAQIIDGICPRNSHDHSHDLTVGEDIGVSKLVRNTDTWLEDGNIVLVAGTRAFRVYKGLLAAALCNILLPKTSDGSSKASGHCGSNPIDS